MQAADQNTGLRPPKAPECKEPLMIAPSALSLFAARESVEQLAGAGQLRGVDNLEIAATLGMAALGVATLASLPRLGRVARLLWRNGTLEGSLVAVGKCLLETLHHTGHATELEMKDVAFRVRISLDGRKDVIVSGVRRTTERQLMQALCAILGPVQNPRYVLT